MQGCLLVELCGTRQFEIIVPAICGYSEVNFACLPLGFVDVRANEYLGLGIFNARTASSPSKVLRSQIDGTHLSGWSEMIPLFGHLQIFARLLLSLLAYGLITFTICIWLVALLQLIAEQEHRAVFMYVLFGALAWLVVRRSKRRAE